MGAACWAAQRYAGLRHAANLALCIPLGTGRFLCGGARCCGSRNWRPSVPRVTLFLAMLPDLNWAIRLQEIDNRLAELTREIAALPVHIAEIEKKLVSHERKLEADRAALSANQKERKKCEGDIQMQEQKISKLKDQMLQAKTNEQYRAFQNEIDFCQNEIRKVRRPHSGIDGRIRAARQEREGGRGRAEGTRRRRSRRRSSRRASAPPWTRRPPPSCRPSAPASSRK